MDNIKKRFPVYINACGFNSALGSEKETVIARLKGEQSADMELAEDVLNNGKATVVGRVKSELPQLPASLSRFDSRNNQIALSAVIQIEESVNAAIKQYGSDRVAVIIGTSTSGISDGEAALKEKLDTGEFPHDYHYFKQELGNPAEFIREYFCLAGSCYCVSTACSSSGRAFLSAKRLLKAGLADAVIVGGVDSLCSLTLNGFNGLEALSNKHCNPFSINRDGINIGEAAAVMLLSLSRSEGSIALLGAGDSSDAHHISAPHPEGKGAEEAMLKALDDAALSPSDIGYVNAHGTATPLNDAMESKAINRVFSDEVPVSSTKPLTGHTLGAASAVEAAICWYVLKYNLSLPVQLNDGHFEDFSLQFVKQGIPLNGKAVLSNSFAFGGNNISLIFGYADD
ncbi:beta-ketoacyl-[acyl-carrier-protein] synthase family protein [Vibrio hannami]|uniref:beta-ketoacyl-[acyl-carrier-protein] synthase family protein n=1 Tax=Vibrio hannami TaxID=2717094 RepID=UPI00240EA7C6|nr:beta-ketoacyl-[acyl-carrier-protein] synthase family protein [Vibrio hannami]MDG3087540.1 beta-ketoacyl-[acyl-carrier-protein] synthase family protein [Vibrio hannami]